MILIDTPVWIDHLRVGDDDLIQLLNTGQALGHPLVLGELSLGQLTNRQEVLGLLAQLPQAVVASKEETLALIERRRLWGRGIGLTDAALLAATRLSPDARIWTRDRRLTAAAMDLDCASRLCSTGPA